MTSIAIVDLPTPGAHKLTATEFMKLLGDQDVRTGVPNAIVGGNWLASVPGLGGPGNTATFQSQVGHAAAVFATRTSDNTQSGSQGAFAFGSFSINNNIAQVQTAYGGYIEARRDAGITGYTQGIEVNVANAGNVVQTTSYNPIMPGFTTAYWASAGRPDLGYGTNVSSVMTVNASKACQFLEGIIFGADSLATQIAVDMPSGYTVGWREPVSGHLISEIRSDVTLPSGGGALIFANAGVVLQGPSRNVAFTLYDDHIECVGITTFGRLSANAGLDVFGLPALADQAAAVAAGLPVSRVYVTPDGFLKIRTV